MKKLGLLFMALVLCASFSATTARQSPCNDVLIGTGCGSTGCTSLYRRTCTFCEAGDCQTYVTYITVPEED